MYLDGAGVVGYLTMSVEGTTDWHAMWKHLANCYANFSHSSPEIRLSSGVRVRTINCAQ